MIRCGLVGLGKMGISHCAIVNAHPKIELVAVCDSSALMRAGLAQSKSFAVYGDYSEMIEKSALDALVIATPTKAHFEMVELAASRGIHLFVEKPLSLSGAQSRKMTELAAINGIINQVGYHNRFLGTFNEAKKLADSGAIGDLYHILGEAYGPVVLKEQGKTWRSKGDLGGGCLYDYASHVINLMQYFVGKPSSVRGSILQGIYSRSVEDAVYSSLDYANGLTGRLSVNWSDETYRKMSTQITLLGRRGKIVVDATECKVYLRSDSKCEALEHGWNVRYLTDVTPSVDYYLRGEEYSLQIDHFAECISNRSENLSDFESAQKTDEVIEMIREDSGGAPLKAGKQKTEGAAWRKLFGDSNG